MLVEPNTSHIKHALTTHAVHPLLSQRWSPRSFSERLIDHATIASLFEAARWSASGGNGQPWSFIIASREDPAEFSRLLDCLMPGNAEWAKNAALLGIGIAQVVRGDGKTNRLALYDLGLAMQNLSIQALTAELYVHQMGGFSIDKARETFHIPETHELGAAFAIGYLGDATLLSDSNREREVAPRTRKPLEEFVFTGDWGHVSTLIQKG